MTDSEFKETEEELLKMVARVKKGSNPREACGSAQFYLQAVLSEAEEAEFGHSTNMDQYDTDQAMQILARALDILEARDA